MLSFIVIGRNEEKNLGRCLQSIRNAAHANIRAYEIIYVDSKSTDGTLRIAERFGNVRIFRITGTCNTAIARNIGAREAQGDVFFFVDADMEVSSEFLRNAWNYSDDNLIDRFVSGARVDIEADSKSWKRGCTFLPGGVFLISRSLWEAVGGMNPKYVDGEDYDLGLRLMKKGAVFVRKKEVIVNHYTVSVFHRSKIWNNFRNKYSFYNKSVLLRDHLFTPALYRLMWLNDKTFIALLLFLAASIVLPSFILFFCSVYLLSIIARALYSKNKYIPFYERIFYYLAMNVMTFVYVFIFFPKRPTEEYVVHTSNSETTNQ